MTTTTCETCPLALTCIGLMQGAVTIASFLKLQGQMIEEARISYIEDELADAYAVMAGELTNEEFDEATEELNDTRVAMHGIDPEIYRRHRLESIESGQKETEELILAVQNVFGTLALEGVSCHGPEVGLTTRLNQADCPEIRS